LFNVGNGKLELVNAVVEAVVNDASIRAAIENLVMVPRVIVRERGSDIEVWKGRRDESDAKYLFRSADNFVCVFFSFDLDLFLKLKVHTL